MGFIMFCVGFLLIWWIVSCFEFLITLTKGLKKLATYFLDSITHKSKMKKMQMQKEERDLIDNNRNRIITDCQIDPRVINRASLFEKLNPYCDKALIEKYKREFLFLQLQQIEDLENAIARSHFDAIKEKRFDFQNITNEDIKRAVELERVVECPITMIFYKLDKSYIITIKNTLSEETITYQSKRHETLLKLANDIYENIREFKLHGDSSTVPLKNLYNENDYEDILKIDK